ncbi:hypothetical protein SSPIM334S_07255 [Streptomyces spiroverticillatus]
MEVAVQPAVPGGVVGCAQGGFPEGGHGGGVEDVRGGGDGAAGAGVVGGEGGGGEGVGGGREGVEGVEEGRQLGRGGGVLGFGGGGAAVEPAGDGPVVRVGVRGSAEGEGGGDGEGEVRGDAGEPAVLLDGLAGGPVAPGEADGHVVAEAVDDVVGAGGGEGAEGEVGPGGELLLEEGAGEVLAGHGGPSGRGGFRGIPAPGPSRCRPGFGAGAVPPRGRNGRARGRPARSGPARSGPARTPPPPAPRPPGRVRPRPPPDGQEPLRACSRRAAWSEANFERPVVSLLRYSWETATTTVPTRKWTTRSALSASSPDFT